MSTKQSQAKMVVAPNDSGEDDLIKGVSAEEGRGGGNCCQEEKDINCFNSSSNFNSEEIVC
jgi:hypothetical protein